MIMKQTIIFKFYRSLPALKKSDRETWQGLWLTPPHAFRIF